MLVSAGSMGHEVTCRTASETHSCPDGEQTGVAGVRVRVTVRVRVRLTIRVRGGVHNSTHNRV